ncbi:MAG: hypothetical protein K8R34_09730 [Methanosarcinales archaeon]|nr:hypothetical protein [Methanosarcinales archaeon]MCD4809911.1 hypothetical protein [Methanosarcinales archaeon]
MASEGEKSDKVLITTALSSETTDSTYDVTPPSAPVRLEADGGDDYVKLKWNHKMMMTFLPLYDTESIVV